MEHAIIARAQAAHRRACNLFEKHKDSASSELLAKVSAQDAQLVAAMEMVSEHSSTVWAKLTVAGLEVQGLLLDGILRSEARVALLEDRVVELEERIALLEERTSELEDEQSALYLREIAVQFENKLHRRYANDKSLTPTDVVHATFARIAANEAGKLDESSLRPYLNEHKLLGDGIAALKHLGTSTAHPHLLQGRGVRGDDLRVMIDTSTLGAFKVDAHEVLDCLIDLAAELGETIFVQTMKPKKARK
jgi:hypothetical protein